MHSLDCKTRNQKDKSLAIKFFRKQKTQKIWQNMSLYVTGIA